MVYSLTVRWKPEQAVSGTHAPSRVLEKAQLLERLLDRRHRGAIGEVEESDIVLVEVPDGVVLGNPAYDLEESGCLYRFDRALIADPVDQQPCSFSFNHAVGDLLMVSPTRIPFVEVSETRST